MADTENDVAPVEAGETDEPAEVIRPASARSAVAGGDEEGAPAEGGGEGVEAADDGAAAGGAEEAAGGDAGADAAPEGAPAADPEPEAEPQPEAEAAAPAAEPEAAADAEAASNSRPPSARPAAAAEDTGPAAEDAAPADGENQEAVAAAAPGSASGSARASKTGDQAAAATGGEPAAADTAEAAPAGAAEGAAEGGEPVGEHHPDVITDINHPDAADAHAEVDAMAQEQAREVIRSRQSTASGERPKVSPSPSQKAAAEPAEAESAAAAAAASAAAAAARRVSTSNASVRSAGAGSVAEAKAEAKAARQQPVESLGHMSVQPPSPSKIKSGPWLTGTYKLPKSGKIISGEELCDALERMTNAYIDKYSREKAGPNATKEIMPGAATVYNTKKLSPDEYDTMIARLYKPKERGVQDTERIQLVTLKFGEDGAEHWLPVKQVSPEEQQSYMVQLYQRCLDNRKKTQEQLAAKYLKPLGQPRKA